jgi:hypothetical protein
MRRRWYYAAYLLLGVCLFSIPAFAQSNGAVKGIVKDTTGAVLPGAAISLRNRATDQRLETLSNEAGTYAFPFVPPGEYTMSVDMAGFRRMLRPGVKVVLSETIIVDPVLEVGEVSSEITVTGEAPLVQTTTTALGRVVSEEMMTGVPLSSRNFTQILALTPGVTSDVPNAGAFGRNSVNISANGARPFENSLVINGLAGDNNMSQGFEDTNDKTGTPTPSPDAIQEFKVQAGLYDAEFGRVGGANVSILTKTGGSTFHGTLFEFLRNDALNANDFFANRNGVARATLKQNQFGGTLGGPINSATFFFVSYQGTRQVNGVASGSRKSTFLPALTNDRSAATLGAKFGGQSGTFGGKAVATDGTNINPVALAVLNARLPNGEFVVPNPQTIQPNGSGFSRFSELSRFWEDQIVLNLDHAFKSGHRFAVKTFFAKFPDEVPFSSVATVPGFGEKHRKYNANIIISDTYAFSPNFLNDFRIGYNRSQMRQIPIEPLQAAQLGITGPVKEYTTAPSISVSGLFAFGPQGDNDQETLIHTGQIADTFSLIKGRHQIRWGGSFSPTQVQRTDVYLKRGSITFNSFPDFLLGMSGAENGTPFSNVASAGSDNGMERRHPRMRDFALFVQDDVRVNQQLALNLGLRYQFNSNEWDSDGRHGLYDRRLAVAAIPLTATSLPPEGTLAGIAIPSNAWRVPVPPPGVVKLKTKSIFDHENWYPFSPRVGLAYRPFAGLDTFVIRSGYGIYWSAIAGTVSEQACFDPWMVAYTIGGASNSQATFQNPFTTVPPATSDFPIFIPFTNQNTSRSVLTVDPTMQQPYTQQWGVNIQYGIKDYLLEIGYAGSKSTHLNGRQQPNQALIATPENPVHGETATTLSNINKRVPILGFPAAGIAEVGSNFDSRYNSLQVSLKKQYSRGLSFLTSYTFGHAIDNVNVSGGRNAPNGSFAGDFYNRRASKGSSVFDRKHRFVASYLYDVPKLPVSTIAGGFVNGWSLSGVTTIQSGSPFSVKDTSAGTIYGVSSFAQFATGKGASDAVLSGRTQDRLNRYFDTSVFTTAPRIGDGTNWGNAGRSILRGPGQMNFDVGLRKAFVVGGLHEDGKVEFRAEAFNVFNHAQFANPASAFTNKASFGVISDTVVAPRIIQFALKYQF